MINLGIKYLDKKINPNKIFKDYSSKIEKIHDDIINRKISNSKMVGWMDYPQIISKELINEIETYAKNLRNRNIKNILIISIGGSYNGVRALIDMCYPIFNRPINFYYAHTLSSSYLDSLKNFLSKEDFFIIVISKSGSTLEPAISLRIFYEVLLKKYGVEESENRIVAITSKENGSLNEIAKKYNWKSFYIPENIGGRFSTLTAIGLLPLAIIGIDIKNIIRGAKKAMKDCSNKVILKNSAYQYAILRNYLNINQNKKIEIFGSYDEEIFYFLEHLKQLFGESEGKNKKGLFPVISRYTTDLHSMGQYYQDGSPIFFETIIKCKKNNNDLKIKKLFNNLDNLDSFTKMKISDINKIASKSVMQSHLASNNSTIEILVDEFNAETYGYLYYWFSIAVTVSASLLKVDPFNQPGVEDYKKQMKINFKKK